MAPQSDFYSYRIVSPLSSGSQPIGTLVATYQARRYQDIRNLGNKMAYLLTGTFRIIIPNTTYESKASSITYYAPGAQDIKAFDNYPAILTNSARISYCSDICSEAAAELIQYSPRTVNSSVMTSKSDGSGDNYSTSHQRSVGSSTEQSNSYGVSASLGFFGDLLTGGISGDYSHTWGSSSTSSSATSMGSEQSGNRSNSDSMSIKDWSCNTYVDVQNSTPTWVWGQEYPWNVLQYNNANCTNPTSSSPILLPEFLKPLLLDTHQALPPSQLSQFGIDFTMKSMWLLEPVASTQATIKQSIGYFTASHSYTPANGKNSASVSAYLSDETTFFIPDVTIDLCLLGLDPLIVQGGGGSRSAIIGFLPHKFFVTPVSATATEKPTPFKIVSASNDLLVSDTTSYGALAPSDEGAGFSASETALTAQFTPNCTSLQLAINFKVADVTSNYVLYMKHWKMAKTGLKLEFSINDHTGSIVTKYVDSLEAEGGDNNLLSLTLRNLDYGSVDFHDFLHLGLNTISLTISPIGGDYATSGYQMRAISIESV